jgi:hypothetical protein
MKIRDVLPSRFELKAGITCQLIGYSSGMMSAVRLDLLFHWRKTKIWNESRRYFAIQSWTGEGTLFTRLLFRFTGAGVIADKRVNVPWAF